MENTIEHNFGYELTKVQREDLAKGLIINKETNTMTNNTATPRPWRVEENNGVSHFIVTDDFNEQESEGYIVAQTRDSKESKANAELIVNAVNSHDELIEALKVCEKCFNQKMGLTIGEAEAYSYIKQALKSAGEI